MEEHFYVILSQTLCWSKHDYFFVKNKLETKLEYLILILIIIMLSLYWNIINMKYTNGK